MKPNEKILYKHIDESLVKKAPEMKGDKNV